VQNVTKCKTHVGHLGLIFTKVKTTAIQAKRPCCRFTCSNHAE